MTVIETFLAVVGGSTVVAVGAITLLGKMVSARVVESIRVEHAKELEGVRYQLELLRDRAVRFDAEQFKSYAELWAALYDLRRAADKLWERATPSHFREFGERLLHAEVTVGRKRLLLEPAHAHALDDLIDIMWRFRVGKHRLIDLRREGVGVAAEEISRAVQGNGKWVDDYKALMAEVELDFRHQLRGSVPQGEPEETDGTDDA